MPVSTPFGDPSDPRLLVGRLGGRQIVFLPRHGGRPLPPHRVNYRANLWALRTLGVRRILAPSAVGALRPDLAPGTLVVPDQVVDATWGRESTFYDDVGAVVHVGLADPYCPQGRRAVVALPEPVMPVVDGGTMVVIQGPRFSTRAESRRNAAAGGDVVGMTGMPEAALARELALCYTSLAVVTDADAGVEASGAVSHQAVLAEFARSVDRLPDPSPAARRGTADRGRIRCRHALDGLTTPFELP